MKVHFLRNSVLVLCFVMSGIQSLYAQLSPGDISIVGFNSDLSSRDGFAFVTWVTLLPGTVIKFSDNGFNSSSASNSAGNLRDLEQTATWTASTTVVAGTIVKIEGNGTVNTMVASTGTVSVVNSSGTSTATFFLTNGGDNIIAHQGSYTNGNTATATLSTGALFAISWQGIGTATTWLSTGTTSQLNSYLPSDLASHSVFLASNAVGAEYTGPKTGLSIAMYKAAVNNPANWTTYTFPGGVAAYSMTSFTTSTMPVTLTGFSGKATERGNLLTWTTASEINAEHFIVERSADASRFSTIAKVNAGEQSYTYLDQNNSSIISFYRLQMVDRDGSIKYSPVVRIETKAEKGYSLSPNPVKGTNLQLKFKGIASTPVMIQVTDMGGKIHYTASVTPVELNSGTVSIPASKLASGIYSLRLFNEQSGTIQTLRFIKE